MWSVCVAVVVQNMDINYASGEIKKHGTFFDVAHSMETLRSQGVTSMYVVGALERDNGWGDGDVALKEEEQLLAPPKSPEASDGDESDGRCVPTFGWSV